MRPGASDDLHTHVARARPAWTTRPGGRAPRVRRTAPPGGDTPAHGARRTRSRLVLGGLVLAAVLSTRWVRLNCSPSVPRGVYRLAAVSPPLARCTLVVLPVPAGVRPWQPAWVPLLKPVAAVADDLVCISDEGLWVEDQWYGPVYQDAWGKPICAYLRPFPPHVSFTPLVADCRNLGELVVPAMPAQRIPDAPDAAAGYTVCFR